jgi:hypothetical protein
VAYDDGKTPMVGAVTDGAAKIKLQLIAKNSKAAFENLYWHLVDPQMVDYPHPQMGTLLDGETPVSALPVVFNANGVAEAVYRAPENFVRWGTLEATKDKEIPERYVQPTLDIASYIKNGKDPFAPIRLKRPPVVLVHGLWGCGDRKGCGGRTDNFSWREFEPKFIDKGLFDTISVDYFDTNASSFATNAKFIKLGMNDAVKKSGKQGFAASKVDIIGNSMGGLLPREYCRNNVEKCKNGIHKFITTDSPHLGSELAKLIKETSPQRSSRCYQLLIDVEESGKAIWKDSERTILKGALVDLANDSEALRELAESPSPFLFKAIVGSVPFNVLSYDPSLKNMWVGLMLYCGYGPHPSYTPPIEYYPVDSLFLEDNDRIVSISSQKGGAYEYYRVFNADHLSVLGQEATVIKIKEWLDEP